MKNDSLIAETLSQAKEKIWVDINASLTKLWPSIEIIFEQEDLL